MSAKISISTFSMTASFLILALTTACGWGYAAETYRPDKGPTDGKQVTYIKPERTVQPEPPKDNCAVDVFTLYRIDQTVKQTKELKCRTGQVMSLMQKNISNDELRNYQLQNLPIGEWYVLVDPAKADVANKTTVSNDHLMGMSKIYSLKYYQRMANTGFIIYTFVQSNTAPTSPPQ